MELLVEKSSQRKSFVKLTSPWRSQASLDEIHFPSTTVFSCLSSALGIHQIRTKVEWAFAFENPLAFYFLPALSQHLLEKKCFVAESFALYETVRSTLHGSASWLFSSSTVLGKN